MELWHALNRGVEKRNIVLDDQDRRRFVANLFAMNDSKPVDNLNFYFERAMDFEDISSVTTLRERDPLVQIHGWCLMNNHYHLLLSELKERGISKFLMKLNVGYTKYFNERYKRDGVLFQGRTKKKHIDTDAYFLWILYYIHFNPLDYRPDARTWRTQCLANPRQALAWLKKYRWSSFPDYAGVGDTADIIAGSFLFEDRKNHMREAERYLKTPNEEALSAYSLEQ